MCQLIFTNLEQSEIKNKLIVITTTSGLTISKLKTLHQLAKTAVPGADTESINYLSSENSYKARYRADNCESEIKSK